MSEFRNNEFSGDPDEKSKETNNLNWLNDDESTQEEDDDEDNLPYDPQKDDLLRFQVDQNNLDQNVVSETDDLIVDREMTDIKRSIRRQLGMDPDGKDGAEYTFFPDEKSRRQLFENCKGIAQYLHDQNIADLVLVDRSARPAYVGVRECWHRMYVKDKLPGIFFVNPKGFKSARELNFDDYLDNEYKAMLKGDSDAMPSNMNRDKSDIQHEFALTYKRLMVDRDKPILLFDTCIHSGKSLIPVKKTLEALGFDDLRIGAVRPADYGSRVKNEFFISSGELPIRPCTPFGNDQIVQKTYDHIYSSPGRKELVIKKSSILLRQEIKKAVNEYLDQEQVS